MNSIPKPVTIYSLVIYVKISLISVVYLFSIFKSRFCYIHWFYPCRSFRHRNWWRHKL